MHGSMLRYINRLCNLKLRPRTRSNSRWKRMSASIGNTDTQMLLNLVILCVFWYSATIFATLGTKEYLAAGGNSLEFTLFSFGLAFPVWFLVEIYVNYFGNVRNRSIEKVSDHATSLWDIARNFKSYFRANMTVAVLQACHVYFTNITIGIASIKFAYMFQTIEPLMTLLLQSMVNLSAPDLLSVLSLLPVPLGIFMSTYGNRTSSSSGPQEQPFLAAFLSVVTISARNVFFKGKDTKIRASPDAFTSVLTYWRLCAIAFITLIPAYFYSIVYSKSITVFHNEATPAHTIALVKGGFFHIVFNAFSFVVLAKIEPVSHSLLNVLKRILAVMISMVYFHTQFVPTQVLGIAVANLGVIGYGIMKHLRPSKELPLPAINMGKAKMATTIASLGLIYLCVIVLRVS